MYSFSVPAIVPVLFGILTPLCFTLNGMLTKHLITRVENPFDPSTLSFGSYGVVNFIMIIAAVSYWNTQGIDWYLFWVGVIGSSINSVGIVCIQNAIAVGPAGPASALAAMSTLMLVVVQVIKNQKMLGLFELLGFILGLFGVLVLVIPQTIFKLFCCCGRQ